MSHEHRGRRWAGEPIRPVADYFDKLMTQLQAHAPLDAEAQSLRYDELACMRRALAVAAAGRHMPASAQPPATLRPQQGPLPVQPIVTPSSGGRCTTAIRALFESVHTPDVTWPVPQQRCSPHSATRSRGEDEALDALLAPRSRAELALRRRALWSDAGERAACDLLGRWNGEFKRLVVSADDAAARAGIRVDSYAQNAHDAAASPPAPMSTAPAASAASAASSDATTAAGSTGVCRSSFGLVNEVTSAMGHARDEFSSARAAEAAEAAARAAEAAARAAVATADAAREAFSGDRRERPRAIDQGTSTSTLPSRSAAELKGEAGWKAAWRPLDEGEQRAGTLGGRPSRLPPSSDTGEAHRQQGTQSAVPRPFRTSLDASPPSWHSPHVPTQQQRDAHAGNAAREYTCAGVQRLTAGGGVSLMPAAAAAAANAASSAAVLAAAAAAQAEVGKRSDGGCSLASGTATKGCCSPSQGTGQQQRRRAEETQRAKASKRRRWFKTVAVVMSKRGGRDTHRFVDITNGISEFHFGR